MENSSSPLDTLRQLKEMLDSGALTPTEFEALKQRLVFTSAAPEPAAPNTLPTAITAPPAAPAPLASNAPVPPLPVETPPFANLHSANVPAVSPEAKADEWVFEPAPEPALTPEAPAAFPDRSGYPEPGPFFDDSTPDVAGPPAERNSSLGLVLAIGAVLVFLAVVAYLGFTRPASEHISSTSQTAADSVATPIETGPQVAPLSTTTAAPETVRVAPTNPAPVIQPRAAAPVADSVAPAVKSPVADSAGNQ
ncbi:SHOCT domain-containing protein [Hymenobacter sp. DH14]|uniref:SHOCT domain-containing protein n=1 Tax=Hymenobacter cyanobacteriorum TaxID=2926463 RepID=A0A9X1VCU5_9BACT|nr:SHOCT domain-containing protein [Hymenobacter cyanobacteriorum]MCI1186779.1 SHOCT domain-containing protein [Hymenobacter cyanobacteriorum]